ncbi:hypothetical protein ACFSQ7_25775 [Paenibacillus rhizoplanae]
MTPESEVLRRGIVIIPETFTFLAYKEVFISHGIGQAYKITLFRTIVGTLLNVFFTVIAAYPLSKKIFTGPKPIPAIHCLHDDVRGRINSDLFISPLAGIAEQSMGTDHSTAHQCL